MKGCGGTRSEEGPMQILKIGKSDEKASLSKREGESCPTFTELVDVGCLP